VTDLHGRPAPQADADALRRLKVMVVHGRDTAARDAMFEFLLALRLHPMEWSQLVSGTGSAAPYVGQVLDHAFAEAAAVVVLLTPDDEARLREPFRDANDPEHERRLTPQARANVLFEAGMALGLHPERTVIVELGKVRPFSDIHGRHVVRLDGSTASLIDIANRLEAAGCLVDRSGTSWALTERFEAILRGPRDGRAGQAAGLADLVASGKSGPIKRFPAIGWDDALSLLNHHDLGQGWALDEVRFRLDPTPFAVPPDREEPFRRWYAAKHEVERLEDDGVKYMVLQNPIASTDSPTLTLRLGPTRYSETLFYHQDSSSRMREEWISDLVQGDLQARFAHSFCMHAIVVTADDQLLLTERSSKVSYGKGMWSASCEESLADVDIAGGMDGLGTRWARRLLDEELGLDASSCDPENMRLLSIFLEADLPNVSACVGLRVNLTAQQLRTRIQSGLRPDSELSTIRFLAAEREALLDALRNPTERFHPTTRYRLLMATLWLHGPLPGDAL
jgi:predicted nucleotide-binding protein